MTSSWVLKSRFVCVCSEVDRERERESVCSVGEFVYSFCSDAELRNKVSDDGLRALAEAGCGSCLEYCVLYYLQKGVTDAGLCALAAAGFGSNLTHLSVSGLKEGVTDVGLQSIAEAGCGSKLTTLTLLGTEVKSRCRSKGGCD